VTLHGFISWLFKEIENSDGPYSLTLPAAELDELKADVWAKRDPEKDERSSDAPTDGRWGTLMGVAIYQDA
jgi:hypothetical protein